MRRELTQRLRAAAPRVAFPPTPELIDTVAARLDSGPMQPARRARATAVALACVVAVATATLAASERARSAIIELVDVVPGVEITRAHELPAAATLLHASSDFGRPVSLDEARARSGFALRLPAGLSGPDEVYLDDGPSGTAVTAVYGPAMGRASLVFTQWHPSVLLFRKLLRSPDTRVTTVQVDGVRGLWIVGVDHEVFYLGMDRRSHRGAPSLAGAALVWQREGTTFRLEGRVGLGEALGLVRILE